MCKVYTGYCGKSEIEHGLCACTVDNPLAKARGLSLRTGAQTMLYLPHAAGKKEAVVVLSVYLCIGAQAFAVPGVSEYTVASNMVRNRIVCYCEIYLTIENTVSGHIRAYCIF